MNSYKIINSQEYNNWIENCPIKILKTQVIEKLETKERFLQIKFKNLTKYIIGSIYMSIKCYDDTKELVNSMKNVNILDIKANSLDVFGGDCPIKLDDNSTHNVEVTILKVSYGRDLVWKNTNSKAIKIKCGETVNYKDELLEQLKKEMGNFKDYINYFPSKSEKYWTCTCGEYNDFNKDYCGNCGISLNFLEECFNKNSLEKKMKDRLEKEKIRKEEEEFLKKEKEIKDLKIKNKLKIIICIVFAIFVVVRLTTMIINNGSNKDFIKSYCDSSSGRKMSSIEDVIGDYSCGNLALYLKDKDITKDEAQYIMDNGNKEIYNDFYKIQNKELYEFLDEEQYKSLIIYNYSKYSSEKKKISIIPYNYLVHLYNNNSNYKAPEYLYENFLSESFYNRNYDEWKKVVTFLPKYGYSWGMSMEDFFSNDPVYDYKDKDKKVRSNLKYANYYYENSGDYYCTLLSFTNTEYVRKNLETVKDGIGKCEHVLGTVINNINSKELQNYIDASGDITYTDYIGNYINELVFRSYANSIDPIEFEAKLKILINNGVDINRIQPSAGADPGSTPLDVFIYKSANQNEKGKEIYKILKKYGAKCNTKCHDEKYFK